MKELKEAVILGKWTGKDIDNLIYRASRVEDICMRIDMISEQFLGVSYRESTLIGDAQSPEIFVMNLEAVDCLTFIDYVEAMRLSRSFGEFKEHLKRVRYQSGVVSYDRRNHFFTDWIEFNKGFVEDITGDVGGQKTKKSQKILNIKEDGTYFLEGIAPIKREVFYIPAEEIDDRVMDGLMTGDYAGIYSERDGLDVSHVGIIIKNKDITCLRHASSLDVYRKVIDQDLKGYLEGKPGLTVLRARATFPLTPGFNAGILLTS